MYFESGGGLHSPAGLDPRDLPMSGTSSRKYSLSSIHSVAVSERSSIGTGKHLERNRDTIARWVRFVGADTLQEDEETKSPPSAQPSTKGSGLKTRMFSKIEIDEAPEEHSPNSIRSLE